MGGTGGVGPVSGKMFPHNATRRIFDADPEQQGVVLNGPVHQGGPATQGLQQLSQSVLNTPSQQ
jgi:hypothetical protein